MKKLADVLAPPRLGGGFRRLVAANWWSNLGDGMALSAGPLLIAAQTRSPLLIALSGLLLRLPWLLFGLHAGVLADRVDRRLLVVVCDLLRIGVVAGMALSIATDRVNVGVILVAMFLTGVAEVFADSATSTLLPMLVDGGDLGLGSARMGSAYLLMNQMIGPPLGAALFGVGMAWPFLGQIVCGLVAVRLISRIRLPALSRERGSAGTGVGRELAAGLRFAWRTQAVRTLVLATVGFNVMLGAGMSVLVLYATEQLHLGEVGFGLLTSSLAVGGVLGTVCYQRIEAGLGVLRILRWGLVLETLTHLGFALTTHGWVALGLMFVLGGHSFVWSTASRAVRLRAVPLDLQGRVGGIYLVGVFGTMAVGQLAGGLLASAWGVAAPFWFGFAGCAVVLTLLWRQLPLVSEADAAALAAARDAPDP